MLILISRALMIVAIAAGIAGAMWTLAMWIHLATSDWRWRQLRRELEERPRRPLTWD